jgi:hypothetical protein
MTENNEPVDEPLESNLDMVNYIMLHRIYDMMTLIAKGSVGSDEVSKMIQYHEKGFLLGPSPSYSIEEGKEDGN